MVILVIMKYSNFIIYAVLIIACIVISFLYYWPAGVLCFGLFHLFMWLNVTITTLSNALVGHMLPKNDSVYRIICIFIAAICFTLYLC